MDIAHTYTPQAPFFQRWHMILCMVFAVLCSFLSVPAYSQNVDAPLSIAEKKYAHRLCLHATYEMEKNYRIPSRLLTAISIVESGRYYKPSRRALAWPWTVTSGKDGRFFNTKAEALAHVEALQKKGIRNIDVGCMQINLHYHGDNFRNVDEALSPRHNAAYAAKFLTNLRRQHGSWWEAAARYHSATPEHKNRYARKLSTVLKSFRQIFQKRPSSTQIPAPTRVQDSPAAPPDPQNKAALERAENARIAAEYRRKKLEAYRARKRQQNQSAPNQ
jgi:hypothetical protein